MKNAKSLKRIVNLTGVIVLLLGVIPFAAANITTVYADDEVTTEPVESPTEEAQVEQDVGEPAVEEAAPAADAEDEGAEADVSEEAADEADVSEEAADEADVSEEAAEDEGAEADVPEEAADEADVSEEAAVPEASEVAEEEIAEAEADEDVSELVEMLSEEEVQIVDENGEALPLASKEAAEVLANSDPFFWDNVNNEWVGYTESGTGCPANVHCMPATTTPFRDAVTHAGSLVGMVDNIIYVAGGDYHENVVVNDAGLSFTAFNSIEVTSVANAPVVTLYTSGYAVVDKITLNADFVTTLGVYANEVIVNEPGKTGGRLEDGLALVNDGGTVEADMELYSSGGQYRVKDANHTSIPTVNDFEWECGEPNTLIYTNRTYRMTLMNPLDARIIQYYETHGDERSALAVPLYLDRTALERMEDLMLAVNVNESNSGAFTWSEEDEKQIYWNLVGNIGKDNNNQPLNVVGGRQGEIDKIIGSTDGTDSTYNDVTRNWNIWFLWPGLANGIQDPDVDPGDGSNNSVLGRYNPYTQLTFFVYDPQPVEGCMDPTAENYDPNADTAPEVDMCEYHYGCMDPNALNYDPDAVRSDGSCTYKSTISAPPAGGPLPIPVTGLTDEEFIIPVTGIDLTNADEAGLLGVILLVSVMALGASLILLKTNKQKEH